MNLSDLALPLLRRIDPETAHGLAISALAAGLGPRAGPLTSPRLATRLAGLDLPNPLGLAAGLDKNARAVAALGRAGFGFVEVGAATPRPQPGNPKPRLFRLPQDRAVINRFGFNNDGAAAIAARLAARPPGGVVGLNLGANKDSADRAADFAEVLTIAGPFVDFATVNVSSPNTERLRELQGRAALAAVSPASWRPTPASPGPSRSSSRSPPTSPTVSSPTSPKPRSTAASPASWPPTPPSPATAWPAAMPPSAAASPAPRSSSPPPSSSPSSTS